MSQLLGTLEWGIRSSDAEVAQASLEALAALALSQHAATRSGGAGFPALSGAKLLDLLRLRLAWLQPAE